MGFLFFCQEKFKYYKKTSKPKEIGLIAVFELLDKKCNKKNTLCYQITEITDIRVI